jgi:CHAT domain-containing protein
MPNVEDKQGAANARYLLARIEQDRDQLIEARSQVEAALDLFESVRLGVTSQEFRASFLAKVHEVYQFHIDLLMRLYQLHPADGYDGLALQAGERARARSLLEMLTEARADIRQGVDPALVERERKLQEQINAKERRWLQIVSGKHSEEQAAAAKKDVETALTEYHELQAKIRATSPRYAALTQPQPLGLKEIQEQVLDEDTLLLEYAIGEERSFLFAVTPTAIKSYELPKRAEVEAAAKRVYELLTERNRNPAKETLEQRRIRFAKADAEYAKAAAALSQMILGPVAEQLGTKRLLIVSDGALQYVPFAALPKPVKSEKLKVKSEARAGQRTNNSSLFTLHSPLILDHEIVSLPSASVLAVLRKEWAQRPAAAKTVAVLADPVFSENDPRVKPRKEDGEQRGKGAEEQESQRTKANPAPPPPRSLAPASEMKRSARDLGVTSFERLRFSGIEADGIAALAPAGAHLKAVDFEANKSKAMSPELDQYRLVHLATHGLINSQHPELSGIVLSLVNENGQPQDGFLRLHEVYNLKLSADLVVLSACQTALGREVKGEGLIGLTRGFMYAGAARVVASLWNVEDKATATLMRRFYQQILTNGQRPAAALRVAQVSMWQEKKAPYFWAAFLLQGEWR